MSTTVAINGVNYTLAETGDENWGTYMYNTINACAQALQRDGGTFTLRDEIDFGSSYGLKLLVINSASVPSVVDSGFIRMDDAETIVWSNANSDATLILGVNGKTLLLSGTVNSDYIHRIYLTFPNNAVYSVGIRKLVPKGKNTYVELEENPHFELSKDALRGTFTAYPGISFSGMVMYRIPRSSINRRYHTKNFPES